MGADISEDPRRALTFLKAWSAPDPRTCAVVSGPSSLPHSRPPQLCLRLHANGVTRGGPPYQGHTHVKEVPWWNGQPLQLYRTGVELNCVEPILSPSIKGFWHSISSIFRPRLVLQSSRPRWWGGWKGREWFCQIRTNLLLGQIFEPHNFCRSEFFLVGRASQSSTQSNESWFITIFSVNVLSLSLSLC